MLMKTESVTLSSRAMLARLTVSQWTARRLDRRVTEEANTANNATQDAGRFNKRLVSKNALAKITATVSAAKTTHGKRTLPWQDQGARILASAAYLEYTDAMRKHRTDFDEAVQAFVHGYPDFVQDARATLGKMFNEDEYPAAESIESYFKMEAKIDILPDATDFRVSIGDDAAAAIRADIEARSQEALHGAMQEVWKRIAKAVGHMATSLKDYKPSGGKGDPAENIFRDSVVGNVRELAALLPSLNLTSDPDLTRIAARIAAELTGDDAAALRDSDAARASVAAAADAILSDVSDFLA